MPQIGLQMYTCRNHMSTDKELCTTLERVRAIGYRNVQISCPPFLTLSQLAQRLKDADLRADSLFCSVKNILGQLSQIEKDAGILNTDVLRTDSIPEELRSSADGYRRFAQLLNQQGEALHNIGIRYIYHFHSFEFVSFDTSDSESGGSVRGIDILLENTDPRWVFFQPDVFWLTCAGVEVSRFLRRFDKRAFYLHVKDYAIRQLEGAIESVPFHFAPVGEGNLDWEAILPAAKEVGITQFVVEQDQCEGDVFLSIEKSYRNLKQLLEQWYL